mmetsp:Transcript_85130/g.237564  ORF Transcript_85130/g.237564 Transcript_85130/m.237564 type:complete len:477 (-) Transcript_85130:173-1603(-)|eukprot:CAMPEP_0117474264 /NCGR_PEP_ID=MMETSP0784-20121206/9195_1 /TAXON_ID=39447 /ORGANISM="" /LENGTH=476 /DNA_ID=CAMNT_0005268485 /DNA_START=53 /DNA_END=1483 /DNA_ORIENTATION=-
MPRHYLAAALLLAAPAVDAVVQLPRVCSAPVGGKEGRRFIGAELPPKAELLQVQVVTRHGARSPYHSLPNQTNPHTFMCELEGAEQRLATMWPELFVAVDADTGGALQPQPALALGVGADGRTCQPGGLLPEGVWQLSALGRHFRASYGELLDGISPADISVRSMSIPRVLHSTAALLTGFLTGGDGGATLPFAARLPIRVRSDPSAEPMNGLPCPRGKMLSERQDRSFQYPSRILDALAHLFGLSDFRPYIAGIDPAVADVAYTALCDLGDLPCGPGGCISAALQSDLQTLYDSKWCEQDTGSNGGEEASRLLMQPLVDELVQNMLAPKPTRFVLYTGRDLVIGPVAAAMGFFDCRWPPFASHIVLELWASGQSRLVRALFDGTPVTSKIHGCGGKEVCDLADIQRATKDMLGGQVSREAACALTPLAVSTTLAFNALAAGGALLLLTAFVGAFAAYPCVPRRRGQPLLLEAEPW